MVVVVVVVKKKRRRKIRNMDIKTFTKARGCADPLHRRLTPAETAFKDAMASIIDGEKLRHKLYFTNQSSKIQVPLILRSSSIQ